MSRNNKLLLGMLAFFACVLTVVKLVQIRMGEASGPGAGAARAAIVLFLPVPAPFCTEVAGGAQAYADKSGVTVLIKTGQDGTQANLNQNIESLFTLGYKAFSLFPRDPAGCKGLFSRLAAAGRLSVCYGAQPEEGSETSFCVATDARSAAVTATERLIQAMGGKGGILNVLESMTDANTPPRKAGVEEAVARHPGVRIVQTIGDMTGEQDAQRKIESALVARGDEIDGVICTGYGTTVAAATLLSLRNGEAERKYVHFVGIDTDKRVLDAIRNGRIDATLAQNPYGQGYITCLLLDLMLKGWKPVGPYRFIDAGTVAVTRENVDAFRQDMVRNTERVEAEIRANQLIAPTGR